MEAISKVSLVERNGQFYARWRVRMFTADKDQKAVYREHMEPTGVAVPTEKLPRLRTRSRHLAYQIGELLAALTTLKFAMGQQAKLTGLTQITAESLHCRRT
jgi:hypothetical protein